MTVICLDVLVKNADTLRLGIMYRGYESMKVRCIKCNISFLSESEEALEHIRHDWDFSGDRK